MALFGNNRKVVISGMLGNGLEWYDYALYGHMSIVFSKLFFAEGDAHSQARMALAAALIASSCSGRRLENCSTLLTSVGRMTDQKAALLLHACQPCLIGLVETLAGVANGAGTFRHGRVEMYSTVGGSGVMALV